ncbi:hypothetical protein [Streptomyces sp. NY05-11A]|uniref:hypothetical protein n=1 Tax=Streptomyces soliscabiei TaxID=588897 RepID=UPI0039F6FEC3
MALRTVSTRSADVGFQPNSAHQSSSAWPGFGGPAQTAGQSTCSRPLSSSANCSGLRSILRVVIDLHLPRVPHRTGSSARRLP